MVPGSGPNRRQFLQLSAAGFVAHALGWTAPCSILALERDVGEKQNLVDVHPQKARELHEMLKAWRAHVSAPVPTEPNPEYVPEEG